MVDVTWRLVVPVKGGTSAKSRLGPAGPARTDLARAIGLDCVQAALGARLVAEVLVVTPDDAVAAEARQLGATVVPESAPGAGLLPAVADGVRLAGSGPVGVLLGDLPALRPADLDEVLRLCERALAGGAGSVVVPDAEGTGSVLLAAVDAAALRPAFGTDSAGAHERAGSVRVEPDLPRLRRDVDTVSALAQAEHLGLGPRTSAVLRASRATSA